MASLHYEGPLRDICLERHTLPDLASQDMEPVLTMLTLLVCPLHLHVNLQRETIFHDDLATLVLYTLVETSLVARISLYINHQNQGPISKVRMHFRGHGCGFQALVLLYS